MADLEEQRSEAKLNEVEQCLRNSNYSFERKGKGFFVKGLFANGDKIGLPTPPVALIILKQGMIFLVDLSIQVPSDKRMKIAFELHKINDRIPYGAFELGDDGSSISFKVYMFTDDQGPIPWERYISNCVTISRFYIEKNLDHIRSALKLKKIDYPAG